MLARQHNTCYFGWEGRRGEWNAGSRGQIKLWLLQGGHDIQRLIGSAGAWGTLSQSPFPSGLPQAQGEARELLVLGGWVASQSALVLPPPA